MPKVTAYLETGTDPFPHTEYYEDGEQIWPCQCGQTHRGDYGFEDWMHHNCNHDEILVLPLEAQENKPSYGICLACGKPVDIVWPAVK